MSSPGRRARLFFFNDTATTEIYTLSLHDALPICSNSLAVSLQTRGFNCWCCQARRIHARRPDRKSTRLNSSHLVISYAVFCLKKKRTDRLLRWHVPRSAHGLRSGFVSRIQLYLCL